MVVALIVLTIRTERSGVWLLFFLAGPAALGSRLPAPRIRLLVPALALILVLIGLTVVRGPGRGGASPSLVSRTVLVAHGGRSYPSCVSQTEVNF